LGFSICTFVPVKQDSICNSKAREQILMPVIVKQENKTASVIVKQESKIASVIVKQESKTAFVIVKQESKY
jgi:hypothetical protein